MGDQNAARAAAKSRNAKVEQILAAGRAIFMARGYAAASMDEIAASAGVSKATLYVYFAGKADLFASIIADSGDASAGAAIVGASGQEDLQAKLLRFAEAIVNHVLSAETISSYRMVVAEAGRSPELGRIFYENGAVKLLDRLERAFAESMEAGTMRRGQPRRAAEQFIGVIRGDLQLRALLGVTDEANTGNREAIIRNGVEMFVRAYGAVDVRNEKNPGGQPKSSD